MKYVLNTLTARLMECLHIPYLLEGEVEMGMDVKASFHDKHNFLTYHTLFNIT